MVQKKEDFRIGKDERVFDIGARIRELRNEQKMSQQQLAECIGVTTRTLQNYETHQRKLDINLVLLLCDALNVSPNEFFQWDDNNHPDEGRPPVLFGDVMADLNQMDQDDVADLYQHICEAKSLLEVALNTKNHVDYRWFLKAVHQQKKKESKKFIYT